MSDECTKLYMNVVAYNIPEDVMYECKAYISSVGMDFYNEEYRYSQDIKRVKFKGTITSIEEGNIILGCV